MSCRGVALNVQQRSKRAILSQATAGSILVSHRFFVSLLRRWQGLTMLKCRKDSSTTVCPNDGSLCLTGCLTLLRCWAALYCSSVYLMKGKVNFMFLFHPRGGKPCKPWGASFVFSEGGIDTHGLCFGIMLCYYGLYYVIMVYIMVLCFPTSVWLTAGMLNMGLAKCLKNYFPSKKKEITISVHYPHAVFVMRNIFSETAVRVWQFYKHLH